MMVINDHIVQQNNATQIKLHFVSVTDPETKCNQTIIILFDYILFQLLRQSASNFELHCFAALCIKLTGAIPLAQLVLL